MGVRAPSGEGQLLLLVQFEALLQQPVERGLVQFRQVTITSPQPATELWRRAEAEGWLVEQPAVGAAMHEVYGATPWMTVQQQQHYQQVLEAMR